jgi:hypothetical protein
MRSSGSDADGASSFSPSAAAFADAHRQQPLLRPSRRRRSLARSVSEAEPSGVRASPPADSWDFIAMGRKLNQNEEGHPDLVENIARAMRKPPLMRRLASIEAEFAGAQPPPAHAVPVPPPLPAAPAEPAEAGSIAAAIESVAVAPLAAASDLEAVKRRVEAADAGFVMPPHSAEWLGKARRERSRAILRNIAAWIATLFIGGMIIAAMALVLQR